MSKPLRLLDCQNEHVAHEQSAADAAWGPARDAAGAVELDDERVTFWVDEYGEEHPRVRRWRSVREFVLALAEAALLLAVVTVIVALFYVVFW